MFKTLMIVSGLILVACVTAHESSSAPSGSAIFRVARCADCHGTDLAGTQKAPSLLGLSDNWTRPDLAAFLADPDAVIAKQARLGALDLAYAEEMPACADLSEAQRDALAGWLLSH